MAPSATGGPTRLETSRQDPGKGAAPVREIQAVIEGLAESLHRAVAVDDPKIRLLAHTAHDEEVDQHRVDSIMTLRAGKDLTEFVFGLGIRTSEKPVRVPHREDFDLLGRWCFPIRCQKTLLGYLWLIDDAGTLTADEMDEASRTAAAVGEVLFRQQLLDDLRTARERELFMDLVDGDLAIRGRIASETLAAVGLDRRMTCRVAVFEGASEESFDINTMSLALDAAIRKAVRKLPRTKCLVMTRSGRGYLLTAFASVSDETTSLMALATSVRDDVDKAGLGDVLVGIGSLETLDEAHLSCRRAEGTVAVSRVVPDFDEVTRWDELGIYQLLSNLPLHELADVAIPPGLKALLQAESDEWLVDTLDTYLDAGGNVQESARLLHIHRATLYYRLTRIEELTGMSLASGKDRLALHVGIKVRRLLGPAPAPPSPVALVKEQPTA